MTSEVPGYYAPLHRSLTEPILVAGVPQNVAVCLAMAGAIFCLAWHIWALAPLVLITYGAAVVVCRRDPYILDIIMQNRGQKNRYMP